MPDPLAAVAPVLSPVPSLLHWPRATKDSSFLPPFCSTTCEACITSARFFVQRMG
jgi:hypothetical protein